MRRANNLYEQICEPENLRLAFWKAQKGKTTKASVQSFRKNLEGNLEQLHKEFVSGRMQLGNYIYFTIYDPKERMICAADFRERVLHHAVINICEPFFDAYQIYDSYACRKGKGVDAALRRAQCFCRRFDWYLKLDVHKYFDSIDHNKLLCLLDRRFKDERLMGLFSELIESYEVRSGKGIPIGNLTSQYFANLYLGALDHYLKERLQIKGYLRYMDDFLVFGDSREWLKNVLRKIEEFLQNELFLVLNPFQLNRCIKGIPCLGYRVLRNSLRLSLRSRKRFVQKYKAAEEKCRKGIWSQQVYADHILPLLAFVQRADSKGFLLKTLGAFAAEERALTA